MGRKKLVISRPEGFMSFKSNPKCVEARLLVGGASVTDPPAPRKGQEVKIDCWSGNFYHWFVAKDDGWDAVAKQAARWVRGHFGKGTKVCIADDERDEPGASWR
jgi:hypothetical protein